MILTCILAFFVNYFFVLKLSPDAGMFVVISFVMLGIGGTIQLFKGDLFTEKNKGTVVYIVFRAIRFLAFLIGIPSLITAIIMCTL